MKKILVLLKLGDDDQKKLLELAEGRCECMFYSPEWSWMDYCHALQEANIIIGEPNAGDMGELKVELLGRGLSWLDTGTPNGMMKAAQFVETVQDRQGLYISCIEEIAWRRGFITTEQLRKLGQKMEKSEYGQYLLSLADEKMEKAK